MAEEYGVNVPERGISVQFVSDVLVEKVILGPDLAADRRGEVEVACQQHGLGHLVETSTLLWTPRYI
jgi:hypothetical protein